MSQQTEQQDELTPEYIKELRERLELKQEEMAELLDVSVGTIHRWENGKVEPRPKRMRQLKLLQQKVQEFGGETVKNGLNAWLTFSPRMFGGLAGASIEMLLENSFARWVQILQKSAMKMITQNGINPDENNDEYDEQNP